MTVVMPKVILVTGVAPHSLGEAFVQRCLQRATSVKLLCLDREANKWLADQATCHQVVLNLNPLNGNRTYESFLVQLRSSLEEALHRIGENSIDCVVQSAGLYWSGRLLDATDEVRKRLFGVNLLSHVDVLHVVMAINAKSGFNSGQTFSHIDVGSLQGLHPRRERTIYAASKSAGVDFAAALIAGQEVARSVYLAAGPIDTHMLHHNHWVIKANGPEHLLAKQRDSDRGSYRAIFVDCSVTEFEKLIEGQADSSRLRETFSNYCKFRAAACADQWGVLDASECAELLLDIALDGSAHKSGVYLAFRKATPVLRFVRFEQLDRLEMARRLLAI